MSNTVATISSGIFVKRAIPIPIPFSAPTLKTTTKVKAYPSRKKPPTASICLLLTSAIPIRKMIANYLVKKPDVVFAKFISVAAQVPNEPPRSPDVIPPPEIPEQPPDIPEVPNPGRVPEGPDFPVPPLTPPPSPPGPHPDVVPPPIDPPPDPDIRPPPGPYF